MGSVFSAPRLQELNITAETRSEDVADFVSKIQNPEESDREELPNPARGDPCGLYIDGLDRRWDNADFIEFLRKSDVSFRLCRKASGDTSGTVEFDSNGDRRAAFAKLSGIRRGRKILTVVPLKQSLKTTKIECARIEKPNKQPVTATTRAIPWFGLDYREQIRQKEIKYRRVLDLICGRAFPIWSVSEADRCDGYLRFVELTIGPDKHGNVCIGYNIGTKDRCVCGPIDGCVNIPQQLRCFVEVMTRVVRDSGVPIFDPKTSLGVWKSLRMRVNHDGSQVMLVVVVNGTLPEEAVSLIEAHFGGTKSVYLGENGGLVLNHVCGNRYIEDKFLDCAFKLYPSMCFPVNVEAAETLIEDILNQEGIGSETVVIDMDSDGGVYAVPIAKRARKVVAVESNEERRAKILAHAQRNGITNLECVDSLNDFTHGNQRNVVLMHPPDFGGNRELYRVVRSSSFVKEIAIFSCNPEVLVREIHENLIAPSDQQPFKVVRCKGFDAFPNTDRIQLLVVLAREL